MNFVYITPTADERLLYIHDNSIREVGMSSKNPIEAISTTPQQKLPLTEMRYTGDVHGVTAEMQLELRYNNFLDTPLEGVFTFPMLPETSISEVEISIGDSKVQSELREREQARKTYSDARDQGHHATLLEEDTPNIFTMSVGGIEPGQEISVKIRYLSRVDWQNGGGRMTIPLVVAPHFQDARRPALSLGYSSSPGAINPPVASDPSQITYKASVHMNVRPGFDTQIVSPSHDLLFSGRSCTREETVVIDLDNIAADRDLVFTYQNAERNPVASVALEERTTALGVEEKFYLLQLAPPSVEANQPADREIVLCLDASGSMEGSAIDGLKKVVAKIIDKLSQESGNISLGILTFNNSQEILSPLVPLKDAGRILQSIQNISASGGTEAGAAIQAALHLFGNKREGRVERSVVFITDGDTSEYHYNSDKERNIRIHGVGISSAIDHHVLKAVCEKTGGSTYWVHPGEDYDVVAREIVTRTSGPIVRNITLKGIDSSIEIVGGRELWSGGVQTLLFKNGGAIPDALEICGSYNDGSNFVQAIKCSDELIARIPVSKFWAREQLRGDINQNVATQLSLEYGVLCRWTSYVAVQEKEVPGAKPVRVDIPVHMPHGWEMDMGEGTTRDVLLFAAGYPTLSASSCDDDAERLLFTNFSTEDEIDVLWSGSTAASSGAVAPRLLSEVTTFFADISAHSLRTDQQSRWENILSELQHEVDQGFDSWTESQKAELYLTLGKMRAYGFSTAIPDAIRQRPLNDVDALPTWIAAQRALGIQVNL
jgi:Ca-activated chloride channel family protein